MEDVHKYPKIPTVNEGLTSRSKLHRGRLTANMNRLAQAMTQGDTCLN